MRVRYQRGYLRLGHRRCGPDCWEFLWWDREPTGIRIRRKAIIGTIQQYPNVEDAWQASNGLRVSINEARNRQPEQAITVADVVDHYIATELAGDPVDGGKSYATRTVYREFLTRWVKPTWGSLNMPPDKAKEVADLVATTDGMIYHFYFGSTLPSGKMSIAQAVGHKPMTSAEYKNYESK